MSPYLCRPSAPLLTGFSPQTLGISRNRSLSVPNLKLLLLKNSSLASKSSVKVFDCFSNTKSEIQNSPDHLIHPRQHSRRNRQADLLGGFEIDDEFKLSRPLDRKIRRLCTFKDFVNENCSTTVRIGNVHPVGHEAAGVRPLPLRVHRWQSAL